MTALFGPAALVAEALTLEAGRRRAGLAAEHAETQQTEALLREEPRAGKRIGATWHRRQGRDEDSGVYATALLLAVLAAGQRRVRRYCEHVEDRFIFRQELVVMLTPGAVCVQAVRPADVAAVQAGGSGRPLRPLRPAERLLPAGAAFLWRAWWSARN